MERIRALVVDDALHCGVCKPKGDPVELPELAEFIETSDANKKAVIAALFSGRGVGRNSRETPRQEEGESRLNVTLARR